jgi:hypothetical protein
MLQRSLMVAVLVLGNSACGVLATCGGDPINGDGDSGGPIADAGDVDGAVADRRPADGTSSDNTAADSTTRDGATTDIIRPDSSVWDRAMADIPAVDRVGNDAGATDIAATDAIPSDASDAGTVSTDAGVEAGTSDAADGGACIDPVPTANRPRATTCCYERPLGSDPSAATGECTQHSDCTAGVNGRCLTAQSMTNYCSYDQCFGDADCSNNGVCSCDGDGFGGANICVAGNCRVDSDCASLQCAPSYGCFVGAGPEGWFCRTENDLCASDADCSNQAFGRCAFDLGDAVWRCDYGFCIP